MKDTINIIQSCWRTETRLYAFDNNPKGKKEAIDLCRSLIDERDKTLTDKEVETLVKKTYDGPDYDVTMIISTCSTK